MTIISKQLKTRSDNVQKTHYVPEVLQERVMEWYHTQLVHSGSTRMISTIQASMYWHGMRKDVEQYVKTCDVCQRCKKQKKNTVTCHLKRQRPYLGNE